MKEAGDKQGTSNPDVARDGVEVRLAVKFVVLAGVENVEASDPKRDGGSKQQDARVERAADGDPRRGGCDAERESENEMRPAREALGVGVKQKNGQRERREDQRQMVQLRRRENKDR